MNTITCKKCGEPIEINEALQGQIEAQVLASEHKKHEAEIVKIKADAADAAKKQLASEKELLAEQLKNDLEIAKKKLDLEAESKQKKAVLEQEMLLKTLKDDAESAKESNKELRGQLTELTKELREERKTRANVELEAEKKIAAEEAKIREEVSKQADEKQRLNLAAKEKTITDLQKALEDAQRKAAQDSQQLQGELLQRFDLDPTKKCSTYSKGNRQKAAIIAALASDVELYLLDEPTAGLDPLMQAVFNDYVMDLKKAGKTILLSSHILAEVDTLCDEVTIIKEGKEIISDKLSSLRHLTYSSISVRTERQIVGLDKLPDVSNVKTNVNHTTFRVANGGLSAALTYVAKFGVHSIHSAPPTLEELFMRHYGAKEQ